jgi:hypothetical protein
MDAPGFVFARLSTKLLLENTTNPELRCVASAHFQYSFFPSPLERNVKHNVQIMIPISRLVCNIVTDDIQDRPYGSSYVKRVDNSVRQLLNNLRKALRNTLSDGMLQVSS